MPMTRAAAAAALLVLTGCAVDDLQGEIVGKDVDPGYTYVYNMPTYSTICSGSPQVCRQVQTGFIPIIYTVPTCYEITVRGATSGTTCLPESQWNAVQIGDDYTGPDVDPKDRQKEKP